MRKTGEYVKSFIGVHSNIDKMTHLVNNNGDGLKVFILDGTGDISPYYNQDTIDVYGYQHFYRDLSNLTINIIDINTSKYALNGLTLDSDELQEIRNHIQYDSIVFTYMDYEKMFESYVDEPAKQIAHFGAIRGRNDYNQRNNLIQIGLNRFPPAIYLLLHRMMKGNLEYYDAFFDKPTEEYIAELNRLIKGNVLKADADDIRRTAKEIHKVMEMSLLCDIEQNLFRSSLRNYTSKEPVSYTLVFDVHAHNELVNEIRKRFESLGARINILGKPLALKLKQAKNRKAPQGKGKTNAQKIIDYIDGLQNDTIFKIKDLLQATGLKRPKFESTIQRNKSISEMLKKMQTDIKGYYKI